MAESTVAETPEHQPRAEVHLHATIDSTDNLSLHHDDRPLTRTNGNFEIKCDEDQIVCIIVRNFSHLGETWTVAARPKTRPRGSLEPWDEGQGFIFDENSGHLSDYVTVTVTAISGGGSRAQRIYIKTKPRKGKPDPQMQEG